MPRFIREQLAARHDVSAFACGESELDDWIRIRAASAASRGYSRVYVWHTGDDRVLAYFTLSSYAIGRAELVRRQARGEYRTIPALLLGKLALDGSLQGQGLTRLLVADAVTEAVRASEIAGARYLVVDAISERVASIYERFGFERAAESSGSTIRLVARIADLSATLTPAPSGP